MSEPIPNPSMTPFGGMSNLSTMPQVPQQPVPPEPIDFGDIITDMEAFRAQGLEGLGARGIRLQPGGVGTEIFEVPHPLLCTDEQNDQLRGRTSIVDIARTLLNKPDDDQVFERFRKAGGRAGDVMIAWRRLGDGLDAPK